MAQFLLYFNVIQSTILVLYLQHFYLNEMNAIILSVIISKNTKYYQQKGRSIRSGPVAGTKKTDAQNIIHLYKQSKNNSLSYDSCSVPAQAYTSGAD